MTSCIATVWVGLARIYAYLCESKHIRERGFTFVEDTQILEHMSFAMSIACARIRVSGRYLMA